MIGIQEVFASISPSVNFFTEKLLLLCNPCHVDLFDGFCFAGWKYGEATCRSCQIGIQELCCSKVICKNLEGVPFREPGHYPLFRHQRSHQASLLVRLFSHAAKLQEMVWYAQ